MCASVEVQQADKQTDMKEQACRDGLKAAVARCRGGGGGSIWLS